MSIIIEKELIRKKLYEEILKWLYDKIKVLTVKEVNTLLLLYIFNKNITKTDKDDPVFIITHSEIAKKQIFHDFKYYAYHRPNANHLVDMTEEIIIGIEGHLFAASDKLKSIDIIIDTNLQIREKMDFYFTKMKNIMIYQASVKNFLNMRNMP